MCLNLRDGCVDSGEVLSLVSFLELVEVVLDGGLLVGGNLVAELLKLLLGLEDDGVGVVELVDLLLLLGIGSCVASASFFMRSISASVRPLEASMRMLCSLPVALSLADTLRMPLASTSNVTSI